MEHKVNVGSLFIKTSAVLPEVWPADSEAFAQGWRVLTTLDASALDRKLRRQAWGVFDIPGQSSAHALGFYGEKAVGKATARLLAKLNPLKFNAAEIVEVTAKKFLGVPYLTVSAHSRHVEESQALFGTTKHGGPGRVAPAPAVSAPAEPALGTTLKPAGATARG